MTPDTRLRRAEVSGDWDKSLAGRKGRPREYEISRTVGKNDWPTPRVLFDAIDVEFAFVADVAALPQNAKCANFISPDQDALSVDWPRGPCWLNPPYGSKEITPFLHKAAEEAAKGSTVVCLVPVRSSTRWWHDCVSLAAEVRFMKGRICFEGAKAAAAFPTALVVFTPAGGPPAMSFVDLPRGQRVK